MSLKKKRHSGKKKVQVDDQPLQIGEEQPPQAKLQIGEEQPSQAEQTQVQEPTQAQSSEATMTDTQSTKKRSGGPCSVCTMYKVIVKKALGKKLKVTYNSMESLMDLLGTHFSPILGCWLGPWFPLTFLNGLMWTES